MNATSLAEKPYLELRKQIIYGDIMPGELLSENNLSKEFEMSRTPIRNALLFLENDGFVTILKNRGTLVKEISYKELFEIVELNNCIMNYAVELLQKGAINLDIAQIKLHLDRQLQAEVNDEYAVYLKHSNLFARTIVENTRNQIMLQTFDSWRDKSFRAGMIGWKLRPNDKHYSANVLNSKLYEALSTEQYDKIKAILEENHYRIRERFIRMGNI
ncbi:GntR family transcriptional regulator [Gracilibacillus salitolerans]|uniref:GntR family transcriptional regulator n=1 Tax=Gracilibacillus salitolerans TaxID=2663022 RepID=A0A5Q2THJ4_9BACI|nr:GntR family transcriptional regulator [Gracilibacillus salitolerans]QGH33522.1 GntR family transcriptional regulator [Gracilibacillus salitolerans]